jgi:hypothetical protein
MTVIHLHWSRNPKLVRETFRGITVCGMKVPRDQLTAHLTDATCRECLEKAGLENAHLENAPLEKAPALGTNRRKPRTSA